MTFTITPMDEATAAAVRGDITAGRLRARHVVLDEPGAPCRECLQAGRIGEAMVLFCYQPFRGEGPYAVPSPVFLHAAACTPYDDVNRVPELLRSGTRAVRSYDAHHDLVDGEVAAGTEIEVTIDRLFADPRADYLHVHSATAGCYTCRIDRS